MLSFGVLIAFWSPKQFEIEESSLKSISKSRIQGVWDPAHSTQVGIPSDWRHYIWLPPLSTPGCITFGILLSPPFHPDVSHLEFCYRCHSIWMSYIRNSGAGWERRAFQLPRSHISGSAYSAYSETDRHFEIFCCIVPRCSPKASRYLRLTC